MHISRRGLLVGGGAALISTQGPISTQGWCDTPSCTLISEEIEGPYYVDDRIMRRNVTEGLAGLPLTVRMQVMDAKRCVPVANAALDIWHCDAGGIYSGFSSMDPNKNPPPMPPGSKKVDQTRFMRGVQITDQNGMVEFDTIYPGWYYGRPIHIHTKVHIAGAAAAGKYNGGHVSHTGQLYFPEDVTTDVMKMAAYEKRNNSTRTLMQDDTYYKQSHGDSIVKLERLQKGSPLAGYLATITVGVDPQATPKII